MARFKKLFNRLVACNEPASFIVNSRSGLTMSIVKRTVQESSVKSVGLSLNQFLLSKVQPIPTEKNDVVTPFPPCLNKLTPPSHTYRIHDCK